MSWPPSPEEQAAIDELIARVSEAAEEEVPRSDGEDVVRQVKVGGVPLGDCDMPDVVNHPSHYTAGRYEVIDVIQDNLTADGLEGYCIGNVLKYVMRYRHKNGVEDLRKARWYLDRIIGELDG